MRRLTGKTIIVTGASAGVGAATARLCAAEGANVVAAARDRKALNALAKKLGKRVLAVPTDVARRQDCEALIRKAQETFGQIDGLVNNAGYNARGAVDQVPLEDLEQIIEVNLKAPIRLCRLVLPHLREAGSGAIVNVASLAGRVPLDHEATYSASKFGLRGFSFALAEELAGTGITVSAVSPGPIATGFVLDDLQNVPDIVFSQPVNTADEVAQAVVDCIKDGRRERVMSLSSDVLTQIVYLAPGIRTLLKPVLEAKGRTVKARYLAGQRH